MYKRLICTMATALLASVCLNAQSAAAVFNVPFGFQTATVNLPAGEYRVDRINGSVLRVATVAGNRAVMLGTAYATAVKDDEVSTLVFHRYGDKYFLAEYRPAGCQGIGLHKGPAEKEMIAAKGKPAGITLLARSK